MPGLVALGRRWSLGSDDLVLPGCTLFVIHVAWLIGLSVILGIYNPTSESCSSNLRNYILGYIVILTACLFVEGLIVFVSLRGTIFYTRPRSYMEYLLYGRTVLLLLCSIWTILGIVWLAQSYSQCKVLAIKSSVLGIVLYNLLLVILILARAWCLYDSAGRSFVHLKRTEKQCAMRRSASRVEKNRVVQLKTRALYEQNWQKRFHRYCCCIQVQEPQESAFTEIALLFSDFFRDLDIVPSDIVAGLMLLREEQKQSRRSVEQNPNNNILKFLSGVPITPDTKFADFSNHDESQEFEELIYYFKYAAAAYGWPVYAMFHPGKGCCHLIGRCLCCRSANSFEYLDLTDDSCCGCNFTALKKLSGLEDADVVYATFHSAVSNRLHENPHSLSTEFGLDTEGLTLVGATAADNKQSSKGGTMTYESGICLETSLTFQEEMDERCLREGKVSRGGGGGPVNKRGCCCKGCARWSFPSCMACLCLPTSLSCPPSQHSSVTNSAENVESASTVWETPFYVALDHSRRKVIVAVRGTLSMQDWLTDLSADISEIPLDNCPNDWFGHKGMVGAAVNIKKKLLDEMILSRAFSHDPERGSQNYDLVLVGHSLGAGTVSILSILLRPDYPKLQCYAYSPPGGLLSMPVVEYTKEFVTSLVIGKDIVTRVGLSQMECLRADLLDCIKRSTDTKWRIIFDGLLCCREINPKNLTPRDSTDSSPSPPRMTKAVHPTNLSLLLTTHNPLYPPGRIMQIVRTNPKREGLDKRDCAWFAVWRDNTAFDQVLISPVMIGDHLPKNVMTALHKCLQYGRLHGCPNISGQQGNRPSSSPHRQLKKGRDKMETPSSGQSSPSSCLVLNPRSYGDTGPDMNSNMVPSASQVKTGPQSTLNVPQSHLGLGHQTGMQRTASSSPVYASYESLPKTPTADGRAPLARFDTMSEVGSVSSFHSATVEEVKPQQTHRMHDGYCYYVDEDLKSPVNSFQLHPRIDNSPNSNTNNQIVTTAFVEPKPDRTSTSLSDKVLLHRDGSTKVMDRYGNLKGRTSTNDRYRLTYDSGSQSSVNKDPTVRPEQLSLIDKNEHSFGSTENLSSDHSSSLPEALLGQAYTHYHSLSIDSSSPDFEDDIPSPIPHLQQDGTFQHGGVPMETTGLLHKRNDSSVVTMEMDQVRDAERKQGPSMTPSDRVRLLREKYGETKC
ncbi:sn1-specific diacylglycerol lipase alpha-like isoform X1 [Acanthaster planci]|uniref:sn-1-specific diacylglycerol lipase n=1 Tax=Acanthaster planci TaxID=133434 RepID=A0A8B7YL36_ACAPL|nr:sn1-specific diacylglycerol lipase alpha-like isoform X1 [Acanthaster planci]